MPTKRRRGRPSVAARTNQDELLKAALKAFALSGYEGTNVKQLGEKAGIAPSLFYYHFKDKYGLWQAALRLEARHLEQAMQSVEMGISAIDPVNMLKKWMSAFIHFSAGHPEFHQVIAYEMAHPSPRADWLLDHILQPIHSNLKKQIAVLQKAGIIKEVPMANFVSVIIGAANVFYMQGYQMKKLYDVDVFEKEAINQHINTVIDLFLNGIIIDKNDYN